MVNAPGSANVWTPLAALEHADDDIYWLHTDLNSAPLEVTDAESNLCWFGNYETFGKLQGQKVAGAERRKGTFFDQPLCYAGQYLNSENGYIITCSATTSRKWGALPRRNR